MAQPARELLRFPAAGDTWTRAADRLRVENSPRTLALYTAVWRRYRQFLNGRPPDEDTANDLLTRRSFELKPKSMGVERAALVYLLNRVLRLNADLIRAKQEDLLPQNVPTDEEQARLLAACTSWSEYALFALLLGAGLRIGEVLQIRKRDVAAEGWVRVIRKGGHERMVPLKPTVLEAISHLHRRPGDALFTGGYNTVRRSLFDPVVERAGLSWRGFTPHKMRHAFGTGAYRHTRDIMVVKEALGHQNISTTQIYIHLAPDELRDRLPDRLAELRR